MFTWYACVRKKKRETLNSNQLKLNAAEPDLAQGSLLRWSQAPLLGCQIGTEPPSALYNKTMYLYDFAHISVIYMWVVLVILQ